MSDYQRFIDRGRSAQRAVDRLLLVTELRCLSRSPASGRRCTREHQHANDHERRRRSGSVIEVWPRTSADDDPPNAMTYAELLEHLEDLIELAKVSGFGRIVGVLSQSLRELTYGPANGSRKRRGTRPPLLK